MQAESSSPSQAGGVMMEMSRDEYDRLFGQAYNWLKFEFAADLTHEDWEDQAQEAIIRLSSSIARKILDLKKGSVDAYFRTIVRNLAIEEFRRRQRRIQSGTGSDDGSGVADIHDDAIAELIVSISDRELLDKHGPSMDDLFSNIGLTHLEVIVLKMRALEYMTSQQIGEIIGKTDASVRWRWTTGRKKIRAFIDRTGARTR